MHPTSPDTFGPQPPQRARCDLHAGVLVPAGLMVAVLTWAVVVLIFPHVHFVLLDPKTKTGFEIFLAVLSLFVALVLFLFPDEAMRQPLRWVALAFLVLGLGSLGFGYLYPILAQPLTLEQGMDASVLIRTVACASLAVGLASRSVPPLSRHTVMLVISGTVVLSLAVLVGADRLPDVTTAQSLQEAADISTGPLHGLTPWYWALSLAPLVLATAAALGAACLYSGTFLGRWLAVALVLFAGSQVHSMFWPAAYNAMLTTSSVLRLGFTVVVTGGVILELRNVAAERAVLLRDEREYGRRLEDLAVMRADFTAMVVHELAAPVAGIRRSTEIIELDELSTRQRRAVDTILSEASTLAALVADVQASAQAERNDFSVTLRPVLVAKIIDAAAEYAYGLAGAHSVAVENDQTGYVMADEVRIGQVLRNLLSNAARYTPAGTLIVLRVRPVEPQRLCFEVIDHGAGIHPDDMTRIFEKFGRGRPPGSENAQPVPGAGLGLYLSRRIVRACGSELLVRSDPGNQTVFWFDLERAR
jgi:signal transduction histidine kinase